MNTTQYEVYHENKNHTLPDFPYNTYLCSIPLDFKSVKTHWHNEVEIIVIKKGEGIVFVDLIEYRVKKGDMVFVMSGQLHSIEQYEDKSMEYENILFKPVLLKSTGQDLCWDDFISPMLLSSKSITPLISENNSIHSKLTAIIEEIDTLCSERQLGYQVAIKGYLFQIVFLIMTQAKSDSNVKQSRKSLDKIKTILSYIAENYSESISVEDMARLCFYSKSYFMKFFKENMGAGFISYLNDYRLEVAAKMLLASDSNVLDVAVACGFDNLSYFNRSFKKKYGVTPGKYRK